VYYNGVIVSFHFSGLICCVIRFYLCSRLMKFRKIIKISCSNHMKHMYGHHPSILSHVESRAPTHTALTLQRVNTRRLSKSWSDNNGRPSPSGSISPDPIVASLYVVCNTGHKRVSCDVTRHSSRTVNQPTNRLTNKQTNKSKLTNQPSIRLSIHLTSKH
jgi:hypothetical protein